MKLSNYFKKMGEYNNKIIQIAFVLSILVSFITYVIDYNSANVLLSRLTIPAGIGLMGILYFIITKRKFLINNLIKVIILFFPPISFVVCLSISTFFSLNIYNTMKELLIMAYLILYAIILFFVFKKDLIKVLIPLIILTSLIASFIGLYDLAAKNLGWFTFFDASTRQAQSGFRYFGQAGQYAQIMLIMMIPLKYSYLYGKLPKLFQKLLFPTIIVSTIFLVSTGKVAAIIGFGIGVSIFILMHFLKVYKDVLIALSIFLACLVVAKKLTPRVIENIVYRVESRITKRVQGTPEADFVITNFNSSLKAFKDNPISGTGLGAYQGVYATTEIHGTYLKMLGETGLIGVFGYLVFMGSVLYMLYKATKVKNNAYADFLIKMIPFLIGFLVCQAYCYHLRKLEFWILYVVLFIAYSNFSTQKNIPQLHAKETY